MKKLFINMWKAHRKLWSCVIIPNIIFNKWRIFLYRAIGYKNISKHCFIGMKCYLDDMEPKMLIIEDGVSVSFGVYMACHGRLQRRSHEIIIKKGAYVGMCSRIITRNGATTIGEKAVIGACSLVNKDVPAGEVWAGVPAKMISKEGKDR